MHVSRLRPAQTLLVVLLISVLYGAVAVPSARAAGVDIKINFQTPTAPVPAGYLRDSGEGYGLRTAADQGSSSLSYGWVAPGTSTPRDLSTMGRDRDKNLADQRLDTLIHMQMPSAPGSWEIVVPSGSYDVTVAAGDSDASGSADFHSINVEGVAAINRFSPSGGNGTFTRHATVSVRVNVGDGKLTIDATGGTNTKINYVDIASAAPHPSVTNVTPANGATNVLRNTGIAANVSVAGIDGGINSDSINANTVRLMNMSTGTIVPSSVNTSGGGDIITLTPSSVLDPNTPYRFDVTDGVKAGTNNASFLPFSSTFTTGTGGGPSGGGGSIAFTKKKDVAANPTNDLFSSIVLGPDGKMYVASLLGTITRFSIKPSDGTLINPQIITTVKDSEGGNRAIIGMAFDPAATAGNLVLWISHNGPYVQTNAPDWTGKISRLSGPDLATKQDYVINLPHSFKDHMVNSLAFGPDGKLYVTLGSNSAMGAPDGAWGQRPERLLGGAVLQINTAAITSPPLNVKTETDETGPGSYDPYAANAPVKLYATGIRNAYDLVWHTNGSLYTPTNGSAAGGNTPTIPSPLPASCNNRINGTAYTSASNPASSKGLLNVPDQNDFLFRVVQGGYYGHPNPLRCEWVLNGANPTAGVDPAEVAQYPVGTQPDPNYRGPAYDFGQHASPDGAIEYRSNAFGGKLKGKLLVVRYSLNDDIIVLTPGGPNNDIVDAQVGLPGLTGFINPLDLAENPATGDVYVVELGSVSRITLLRPLGGSVPQIEVTPNRIVTNDPQGGSVGRPETVTIRNTGTAALTLNSIAIIGANADQFQIVGNKPTSVAVGASATVQVAMKATGSGADQAGPKDAVLQVNSNDPQVPATEIALRGLATLGNGGTNEPSLQWILDTYQIPVNVGDDNPKDNIINSDPAKQRAPLLGDEVDLQQFKRFDNASPVLIEPLAVFGPTNNDPVVRFGWYTSGNAVAKNELFSVSNNPTSNGQRVNPMLNTGAALDFDPGTSSFGFYSTWPFFSNRTLFSEDALNTFSGAIPHHVRVYPLKDAANTTVPNAYIVAFEENTSGFDYNDVVLIVRNVKSATATATAPVANAGDDQTVVVGTPVTINGTGSDAEGDPLTYNWQQTSGPAATLSGSGSSRSFTPTSIGTYVFTLTISDPGGLSGTDSVVITVTDAPTPNNQAPTANAGVDQTVHIGANVTLNGSGSDADGTILGYRWQQTGGLAVTLSSNTDAQISFRAPDQPTVLTFNLVVTDNQGVASVADEVRIVVTEGSAVGNTYRLLLPLIGRQ